MNEPTAKSIFLRAIEQYAPDQWEDYLNEACAGDHLLREQVAKLLRGHRKLGTFHEDGRREVVATLGVAQPSEGVGTTIGPYKIIEQIGEGGMGVVYMAEQKEPVRRTVALKIIKPGMDTKEVVARFEAERQALALMHHPNVAKVLDAGATDSGRPYFVMDLVRGIPITNFCDQRKQNARQRLELFATVCRAVQHAHQKGIIHRDLKPTNILVELHDVTAVPKVIDFGVAKATTQQLTDRSLHTGFAQMIGTPLYMSPEQAELSGLDIDTRTDIYSLGVVLYELLSGTTPFASETLKQAGYDEMRRIIREDEPPRPSARISTLAAESLSTISDDRGIDPRRLSQSLRGELDWIVMKAMDKDRTRRYDSAGSLAADVRRYLDDEPVVACPPSIRYRFGKFARRNKVALLVACTVLVSLIAGTVGLAIANQLIARERDGANAQRIEAERQKKAAEANFLRARRAVDDYLTHVAENQLLNAPGLQPLRKDLLTLALKYYQEFVAEYGDDPSVREEAGRAYLRAAEVLALLNEHDDANKTCQAAINIFEQLAAEKPGEPEHRYLLAESKKQSGDVLGMLGHSAEQDRAYRQAVAIAKSLVDEFANNEGYMDLLAKCYSRLATTTLARGDIEGASQLYRSGRSVGRADTSDATSVLVKQQSGAVWTKKGLLREAEQIYLESQQIWRKLAKQFPTVPDYRVNLADNLDKLAFVLHEMGQVSPAIDACTEAVEIKRKLTCDFPSVPRYRASLADSLSHLSNCSWRNPENQKTLIVEALRLYAQLETDHQDVPSYTAGKAMCLHNLGNAYKGSGELEIAEKYFRESIRAKEELAKANPEVPAHVAGIALSELCIGLVVAGNLDRLGDAETAYRKAIENYRDLSRRFPANADYRGQVPYCLGFLARLLHRAGRLQEAADAYRECIDLAEQLLPIMPANSELHRWHGVYCLELAAVLREYGKNEEVHRDIQEELSKWDTLHATCPDASSCMARKADLLLQMARSSESEADYTKVFAAAREAIKLDPENLTAWHSWSRVVLVDYRTHGGTGGLSETRAVVNMAAGSPDKLLYVAPMLLLEGGNEDYRRLCQQLLKALPDDFEDGQSRINNWIVRLCGLDPDAVGEKDRLVKLAQDGIRPPNDQRDCFLWALGRAQYRSGNYELAVEWLRKALQIAQPDHEPLICLELAIANHHRGYLQDARTWLDKATKLLEQAPEPTSQGHIAMEVEVLLAEAKRLIGPGTPVDGKKSDLGDPQSTTNRDDGS